MYHITIEQIQCLKALVDAGSFSMAAEKQGKAKSAMIYSIKRLEEQLGFPLIERSGYKSKLTNKGRDFLDNSKKLLNEYEQLLIKCSHLESHIESFFRISISGIYRMDIVHPVIASTMKAFPQTEIQLEREILSGERMLNADMVDLAIFENIRNKKDLDYKQIDEVKMVLTVASNHPFLNIPKSKQCISDLYKYPQIIQRSTLAEDDYKIGVHKESLQWKVSDTNSKHDIISHGLGWGRLPLPLIQSDLDAGKLVQLNWLEDDDVTPIYIAKKKNKMKGKVAEFVWDAF
ncbi:LysR family transcriptional regulator [Marinomonas sp.]|nr:LysR family transcriptional regulator [Marinomonas sp.]MDB4837448.1 LysR family transcriptional regulator [Marinomonas sp.]